MSKGGHSNVVYEDSMAVQEPLPRPLGTAPIMAPSMGSSATILPSTNPVIVRPLQATVVQATVVAQPQQGVVVQAYSAVQQPSSGQFPVHEVQDTRTHQLIPPPNPTGGTWRYTLCQRCCSCRGDCVAAWCQCGCFPLGQVADKLNTVFGSQNDPVLNYSVIVTVGVVLWILDAVLSSVLRSETDFALLWIIIIAFLLRGKIRQLRQIRGSCCEDCLTAFFCTPCSITQMVGEMWHDPNKMPGCNWSAGPGALP